MSFINSQNIIFIKIATIYLNVLKIFGYFAGTNYLCPQVKGKRKIKNKDKYKDKNKNI